MTRILGGFVEIRVIRDLNFNNPNIYVYVYHKN